MPRFQHPFPRVALLHELALELGVDAQCLFDLQPPLPYNPPSCMKILVCDPVSAKGIALLQQRPEFEVVVLPKRLTEAELLPVVKDVVAMVVRSETKVTSKVIEAAPNLRVVGRAGVGVDNVDVEAATQRGVVVMNTPGGNTISTAELSFAMILSLARKVPQAYASMAAGKWDRKQFQGAELAGKTLGVLRSEEHTSEL